MNKAQMCKEGLQEKMSKSLEEDTAKCAKLAHTFFTVSSGGGWRAGWSQWFFFFYFYESTKQKNGTKKNRAIFQHIKSQRSTKETLVGSRFASCKSRSYGSDHMAEAKSATL